MIVEVADRPFIILRELVVTLPEAVAVLTLESVLPPDPSRFRDGVVQSSLVEDLVDGCVAGYALLVVVAEVAFDAAWSPIPRPSELKYEVYCLLWGSMDRVGSMGFDV